MISRLQTIAADLLLATVAGLCISVCGAVYFSCPNAIVASFLFGLGLCTIIFFELKLYTGKVGYAPNNGPSHVWHLLLVWAGNYLGVWLGATLQKLTRVGDQLTEAAKKAVAVKLEDSLLSLFVLAIFCGLMMYIAVEGFRRTPDGSTVQLALVLLPVAVFIICGFEHCIADLYYFSMAGFSPEAWIRIIVITLGNSLGSILFHLAVNLKNKLENNDTDSRTAGSK